uniref:Uncharacterized protein n=1 Tax=Rhizophora mucronata TaxID=61149 RepID=A0A2P2QWC4_RHIMU
MTCYNAIQVGNGVIMMVETGFNAAVAC